MNLKRFDLANGFVFFSIGTILWGIDVHVAGRFVQFLAYLLGWGLFSTLVVYPIKTRVAAKKAKKAAEAEAAKKPAEPTVRPSFAAVRKGIKKG
jgi:hypothetical protein